jgi:integrase
MEEDAAIQIINRQGVKAAEEWQTYKSRDDAVAPSSSASTAIVLSKASSAYLASNPFSKHKTTSEAKTALSEFEAFAGDLPLDKITTALGYSYAEHLGKAKSASTVGKKISYVRGMLSFHVRKGDLGSNPLSGMKIPRSVGTARSSRKPFTPDELESLFKQPMPDHVRSLLSILVTTGMRLDEAALLNWEDIKEEGGVVFFDLTHRDETMKNIGSARKIPVPSTLSIGSGTGQMFPEFKRDRDGKAQGAASKECMKVIRKVTDDPKKVTQSLRHTFKDLLRDADISKEINDFITGHGSGDVAAGYGSGPSLHKRREAIEKVEHPWLHRT